MTDALAIPDTPSGPPQTVKAHVRMPDGKRAQITRKVKAAVDTMVWDGTPWQDAARKAGLSVHRLRQSLELPHVIRYLKEQKQVFRASASARNIHRATEIRDQTENQTAAIQAIRYLDGQGAEDAAREGMAKVTPGVVVTVNVNRGPREVDATLIEVNPAAVPDDQSGDHGADNG